MGEGCRVITNSIMNPKELSKKVWDKSLTKKSGFGIKNILTFKHPIEHQ